MFSSWLKDIKIRPGALATSENHKSRDCPELEPCIIPPSEENLIQEEEDGVLFPKGHGERHDEFVHKSLFLLKSTNTQRRRFAVYLLKKLPLEKLDLYLPQLVQALRLEDFEQIKEDLHLQLLEQYDEEYRSDRIRVKIKSIITKLFKFSSLRKVASYDNIAKLDDLFKKRENYKRVQSWTSHPCDGSEDTNNETLNSLFGGDELESQDLPSFLIEVCTKDSKLSNSLYWYLMIECESQQNSGSIDIQEMYIVVLKRFLMKLEQGSVAQRRRHTLLQENFDLIQRLTDIFKDVQKTGGSRIKKTENLIMKLNEYNKDLYDSSKKFLLPIDPTAIFDRFIPEKTVLFKAENLPCKITLRLSSTFSMHSERHVIYKNGDNLRQDALVIQLIRVFDDIWKKNGLDLKMTPYTVIPTSEQGGFLEYIESTSVATILNKHGTIESYFHSKESANIPYQTKVDNFAKSCAGYSIATYILGVGDRHLDNLLITPDGKIFHVDFAYILGFDPKPMPPPIKLTKEMIDVIGGIHSKEFEAFIKSCQAAFTLLRRNSDLIIELFSSSSVPSSYIRFGAAKITSRLRKRFLLDKSENEACQQIENMIRMSSSAVLGFLLEKIHGLAQSMRS